MENLNKAAMDIQENAKGRNRGRFPTSYNISTRRRSASESSDEYTNDHAAQKEDLEFVEAAVEKLNTAFAKIDRYGHGIPSIRPVRELCGKLKIQLNSEHGAFNRTLEDLVDAEVPGHKAIVKCVEEIRKAVNAISTNESEYIPRMEDIKQHLGALSGIVTTVLELEYKNL